MKIYIKNMVCQGTKFYVLQELEKLGINYNKFELGEIDFKEDLTFREILNLDRSLNKYGLEVTFRNSRLVTEILKAINNLLEDDDHGDENFSNYFTQRIGFNYAYLNMYFTLEMGLPIEKYYSEKKNEKISLNSPQTINAN